MRKQERKGMVWLPAPVSPMDRDFGESVENRVRLLTDDEED